MDATADAPGETRSHSLMALRIVAAIGFLVALALAALGFVVTWWLGLVGLAAVPVLPMGFVLAFEALRR